MPNTKNLKLQIGHESILYVIVNVLECCLRRAFHFTVALLLSLGTYLAR